MLDDEEARAVGRKRYGNAGSHQVVAALVAMVHTSRTTDLGARGGSLTVWNSDAWLIVEGAAGHVCS